MLKTSRTWLIRSFDSLIIAKMRFALSDWFHVFKIRNKKDLSREGSHSPSFCFCAGLTANFSLFYFPHPSNFFAQTLVQNKLKKNKLCENFLKFLRKMVKANELFLIHLIHPQNSGYRQDFELRKSLAQKCCILAPCLLIDFISHQ